MYLAESFYHVIGLNKSSLMPHLSPASNGEHHKLLGQKRGRAEHGLMDFGEMLDVPFEQN